MAVDGEVVGAIGSGLCVFVGVTHTDGDVEADRLADRLAGLRVMDDDEGVMNLSVVDADGEVLVVSQFTLYGDTRRGRRPSFTEAAAPADAAAMFDDALARFRATGLRVETGVFQEMMDVSLVNEGPVTIWLDSLDRHQPRRA